MWRQIITAKVRNQAANLEHLKRAHKVLTEIANRCEKPNPVAAPRQSAADSSEEKKAALSRDTATLRLDALLFGETQSRVVITCQPLDAVKVVERAKLLGVPAVTIGRVGGEQLAIKAGTSEVSVPVTELHDRWWNAIARAMA